MRHLEKRGRIGSSQGFEMPVPSLPEGRYPPLLRFRQRIRVRRAIGFVVYKRSVDSRFKDVNRRLAGVAWMIGLGVGSSLSAQDAKLAYHSGRRHRTDRNRRSDADSGVAAASRDATFLPGAGRTVMEGWSCGNSREQGAFGMDRTGDRRMHERRVLWNLVP